MFKVQKRNGAIVDFDINKISNAIQKAFDACQCNYTKDVIELLTLRIFANFNIKIKNDLINVEDIQDSCELILTQAGFFDVAKKFILYRKKHDNIRNLTTSLIDYKNLVDGYLNASNWRVKENSTVTYSIGGLILSNSSAITANYWLNEIYDEQIANAHKNADFHIHDLGMLSGYCFVGNTVVKTLDGRNPTFKELVDNKEDDIWVYSYDIEHGEVVPAKARNPRVTRKVSELVELVFCNGDAVRCTSDHPFLMRDGTYRKASDLRTNDSIMPLYVSENSEYSVINKAWSNQKSKTYLHRWIAEKYYGRQLESDEVVHHKNGNKHDNRPENIEIIKGSVHRALEIRETMDTELWKSSNGKKMADYNRSEEKKIQIRDFASTRDRNSNGQFIKFAYNSQNDVAGLEYNHRIIKKRVITLDSPIDVYDLTVPHYSNFAIGAGVFVHNCAGWSLGQLVREGLGGVSGKITSSPAGHLSTLCNQMVNFLGILQNEWAGAQAFSSFDTYLAPFIKVDNLTYKEVKQCMQSFIYGVNTPSRWGCVPIDTEILSENGFKKYNEIQEGQKIYTWNMQTCKLELNIINKIITKQFNGKLHGYYNNKGYEQIVTPNHRTLVYKHNSNKAVIYKSEDIFDKKSIYGFPTKLFGNNNIGINLSDYEIKLAAFIYANSVVDFKNDGSIYSVTLKQNSSNYNLKQDIDNICENIQLRYIYNDNYCEKNKIIKCYQFYDNCVNKIMSIVEHHNKIANKYLNMNYQQAQLFITSWIQCIDANNKSLIICSNNMVDDIQHIAVLAGYTSYVLNKKDVSYVYIRQNKQTKATKCIEIPYNDIVWCPNVNNGTAIFRRNGNVFISGQTQAPFTNITLDWVVPNDLGEQYAIVKGKEQPFKYKDCQKEMDMINKAFIEIMIEGDANGRGFQYPIPTYSITKDFDWSETENNKLLFEMTSKYGTPYFSNYVNSDMKPSDIRSMCPLTSDTKVVVRNEQNEIIIAPIEDIYQMYINYGTKYKVLTLDGWKNGNPIATKKTKVLKIILSNGSEIKFGINHLQPTKDNGILHADELQIGMKLPFSKISTYEDLLCSDKNIVYYSITNIKEHDYIGNYLYCFEVDNDDHLFVLANGLITHNCRLRLDLRELRKKNGGYFGSGENTGCYSDDTEILTENKGWIKFKDLTLQDDILTRNNNGEIEIHKPERLFAYDYNGDLYHFNNTKFDMLVTPNHNMLSTNRKTGMQMFKRADAFNDHDAIPRIAENTNIDIEYFELPSVSSTWIIGKNKAKKIKMWNSVKIKMNDWLKFLGIFISEGSIDNENIAMDHGYRIFISQHKKSTKEKIEKLLKTLPFYFKHDGHSFVITNKQLWSYLRENCGINCCERQIPREYLQNCSSNNLQNLLDWLILGGGSINKNNGEIIYYTSSKLLADNIQELIIKTGKAVTGIRVRQPRDSIVKGRYINKDNCQEQYEITIGKSTSFYINKNSIRKVRYIGKVYCCQVLNHTMMVRRNGKATWCGNSIGVVTINMPKIAYLSNNNEEFLNRLNNLMSLAARSLKIKRKTITKLLDAGLYPYTKRYLGTFDNHFSTIGLVGMNEAYLNAKWINKDNGYNKDDFVKFAKETLIFMRNQLVEFQEQYGDLYNLEATPAESTSYRLAKHDKEKYPDIITASENDKTPYYTNSSHLPVNYTNDVFEALDTQDQLQTLYTSGTVFHVFLGQRIPNWKSTANLVKKIAQNYQLPYYTISPTYSICVNHGYINGEVPKCPNCGEETEIYSRITGYYRPVKNWNNGKQEEFKNRLEYSVDEKNINNNNNNNCIHCNINNNIDNKTTNNNIDINLYKEVIDNKTNNNDAILFTKNGCPNCLMLKKILKDKNIQYKEYIYSDNTKDIFKKFNITNVPIILFNDDQNIVQCTNIQELNKYLNK